MLMAERERHILRRLKQAGVVRLPDLREELGVTERTLRRDLERLERRGLLRRTRGDATRVDEEPQQDVSFRQRAADRVQEKRRIGQAVARSLRPGASIALDAGTTALEVARHLPRNAGLTVVTYNVWVLWELAGREDIEIVSCGGNLRHRTLSLVGPQAEELFAGIRVDLAVVGATGVDAHGRLTNSNFYEARVKQAMMQAAARVTLAVDHSKFGCTDLVPFASLADVHEIVTDAGVDASWLEMLSRFDATVRVI